MRSLTKSAKELMISFFIFYDNIFALRDPCCIWSFKIASNLANLCQEVPMINFDHIFIMVISARFP